MDRDRQKQTNSFLSEAYQKIIQLTYNGDDMMMRDLEVKIEGFDSRTVIPINRFGRLDATLHIIRHKYVTPDDYDALCDRYATWVSDQKIEYCHNISDPISIIESDLSIMIKNIEMIGDIHDKRIELMKRISEKVHDRVNDIMNNIILDSDIRKLAAYSKTIYRSLWEYDLIIPVEQIVEDIWTMSILTPIHSWICESLIFRNNTPPEIRYSLGEYDKTEIEYIFDDPDNLVETILSEYASHSLLLVYDSVHIYAYDPDDYNVFIPESRVLQRHFIGTSIDPPIQTVTDDIYCIFHSIFAMEDMNDIAKKCTNLKDLITEFESCQNRRNGSNKIHEIVQQRIAGILESYPVSKR